MNLDTVLQSIDTSFRALHKRDTATSEQLGRNAGFLSGFAEGARYERNLEELKRRLADGPDVSAMPPGEYAFYVAELRDEIDPPMDGEKSNVDKLRDRLDEIKPITDKGRDYMRPSWKGENVPDEDVFAFCDGKQIPKNEKLYLYTVTAKDGSIVEHEANSHSVDSNFKYQGFLALHRLSQSIPFASFHPPFEWTRKEIQEPNKTP